MKTRTRLRGETTFVRLAAISLVWLVQGCGDSPGQSGGPPPDPDPYVSTESPQESMQEADYGDLDPAEVGLILPWTRNRVSKDPTPADSPVRLTDVAFERLTEFDRAVFSFEPRLPGYRLSLVAEAGGGCDGTTDATDAPVHLVVELETAQANEDGRATVAERDRSLDYPALTTAAQTCDEGGKVRWALGISADTEFRMMEMSGQPRLVLDLKHPEG